MTSGPAKIGSTNPASTSGAAIASGATATWDIAGRFDLLSANDAVVGLSRNYGVASLEVKQIRAIEADCKLQVDEDPILAGHAHITGQRAAELAICFCASRSLRIAVTASIKLLHRSGVRRLASAVRQCQRLQPWHLRIASS